MRILIRAPKTPSGGSKSANAACLLLAATLLVVLSGCGLVAFPVRVTSAAFKIVPVAGPVVAAPLDVTADIID